jgi:hypothetical protein
MQVQQKVPGRVDFKWTDGTENTFKPWPLKVDGKPPGANAARIVVRGTESLGVYDTRGSDKNYFVCRAVAK